MATFQGLEQSSAEKQIFHLACKVISILFLKHHIGGDRCHQIGPMKQSIILQKWALSHGEIFRTSKLMSFLLSFALTSCLVSAVICPILAVAFLPLSISFPLLLWRNMNIVLCLFLQTICYFYVWVFDDLWWYYRTWNKATVFGWLFVNWI